jgi:hypothetical protein
VKFDALLDLPFVSTHDLGTETLDRHYAAYQARSDRLVAAAWLDGSQPPCAADNEQSWRARIEIHLRLLPPPTGACNGR